MLLNFITTPQILPTRLIRTGAFLKATNSIASKIVGRNQGHSAMVLAVSTIHTENVAILL